MQRDSIINHSAIKLMHHKDKLLWVITDTCIRDIFNIIDFEDTHMKK